MFKYRPFQFDGINQVVALIKRGFRRIVFQAATGAGKTVLFSGLTQEFVRENPGVRVIIAVHREELLHQTIKALRRVAGIEAAMIIAGHATPVRDVNGFMVPFNAAQVIVGMVETLNNRFKKYERYLGDIGMLIVDECHRGEFIKLYDHFPKSVIIGFTATPISANKRIPLKTHFEEIVSPVTIKELITDGYLATPITIAIKNSINRKNLSVKGNDFDEKKMGNVFSSPKHVENCLKAYEKYCMGEKTIIFNCNVEHSKLVNDAFVRAGYNSRHMDGYGDKELRPEALIWLANTHDAILNNTALYTTGLDEPSIINVIVNRATMSLVLWIQMCGRASRPIEGIKTQFKIIDLGANQAYHLDWEYPHNWANYFHYPEKVGAKKGAGPTKLCVECKAMIHLSVKICPYCGANNAKEIEYDVDEIDLEVLTKGIDIEKIIEKNKQYAPYRSLHMIKGTLVTKFRHQYKHTFLAPELRERLNARYQDYVRQWCEEQGKDYNSWHKRTTKQWMMDELDRIYGKLPQQIPA